MQIIARLYALSKRNVILRYKNSLVGFLWGFIKPLIYLLIFIVIFSAQFITVSNYVLYVTSGLIFWFFFSNLTAQSVQNIISSAGLIKAVRMPLILLPLSELLSELFNFLLTLMVYFVVMYWFGMQYSARLFLLLPCIVLFSCFSFGITLVLSSVNVFLRDVGILWNTIQPALFYLTPIAYPASMIPERFVFIIRYNPIYYFIQLVRTVLYESSALSWTIWIQCATLAMLSLSVGLFLFHKLKNQFIAAI
ncbi:MAG: ABC transporter permease [Phycisphaerales bacterium]|nr:ABC transporter permease [Phycisphaerales bacterium]